MFLLYEQAVSLNVLRYTDWDWSIMNKSLVACTRLYNPLCPSVRRSVTLYFFYDFISLTSLPLPTWSGDLKYGPCPLARDFGSRVSGLVFSKILKIILSD